MNHTEVLTRYVGNFVDELVNNGLTEVVISPGSRSTPLALAMCEHPHINEWVLVDERSAAFFALGIAKTLNKPVAILCTSGTAAANYYPAIVEAYYSRVPFVVLTADRPPELRDVGAPQAINQQNMFANYVKLFYEMALPEATPEMLAYVRGRASLSVNTAVEGKAGPVHLNFPFREPLVPDFSLEDVWGTTGQEPYHPVTAGTKTYTHKQVKGLLDKIEGQEQGLIVCGPQIDKEAAEAIVALAASLKVPVLADPLSQIRGNTYHQDQSFIIETYDSILRSGNIRKQLKPDYIIRFGAMPVSKSYLHYVEEHANVLQFVVENDEGFRDPTGNRTEVLYVNALEISRALNSKLSTGNKRSPWTKKWQELNQVTAKILNEERSSKLLTEGEAVKGLLKVVPNDSVLYVGNSMAVRDLDTFFTKIDKDIQVVANRGASGIDGIVSSGLGAAAVSKVPVTLLVGDLSFYHDLNGLLAAKQHDIRLTILLINNNGGGIFSFLPQANEKKHFEALFGTPLDIDFEPVISMYGGKYQLVSKKEELLEALHTSYDSNGLTVIEVQTDRTENMTWRKRKWQAIGAEILQLED